MGLNPLMMLKELTSLGPRFHGTAGAEIARNHIQRRVKDLGYSVTTSQVIVPGWDPGSEHFVDVTSPVTKRLISWPMLWSGPSVGTVSGRVIELGTQGLWSDAMVWTKFGIQSEGRIVGYIHGRDGGPAAPQPLPAGSDTELPHLAIGRLDSLQLSEWIADGQDVSISMHTDCGRVDETAVGDNLSVLIPGRERARPRALICGHYDTFFNTVGAYDNGSGVVAMLTLLDHWKTHTPAVDVEIVFFTGEEWHLAGSRSYVAALQSRDLADISYVICIDGLGRGDLLELSVGPEPFEYELLSEVTKFNAQAVQAHRKRLEVISRFPPIVGTDHAPFYAAGIPSVHLTFNDLLRLHQPEDLPNEGIAQNVAWTVGLVAHLIEVIDSPARPPVAELL